MKLKRKFIPYSKLWYIKSWQFSCFACFTQLFFVHSVSKSIRKLLPLLIQLLVMMFETRAGHSKFLHCIDSIHAKNVNDKMYNSTKNSNNVDQCICNQQIFCSEEKIKKSCTLSHSHFLVSFQQGTVVVSKAIVATVLVFKIQNMPMTS